MPSQVPSLQGPTSIGACAQAYMACPAPCVKSGVCKLVGSSDFLPLSQAASMPKTDALEICTAAECAEAWPSRAPGIDAGVSTRLIGDAQVRSIMTRFKNKRNPRGITMPRRTPRRNSRWMRGRRCRSAWRSSRSRLSPRPWRTWARARA
eukprot:768660-Pyramimonas_sp.AAC.1